MCLVSRIRVKRSFEENRRAWWLGLVELSMLHEVGCVLFVLVCMGCMFVCRVEGWGLNVIYAVVIMR